MKKSFREKYYPLFFFFVVLALDCYLLQKQRYGYRIVSKSLIVPFTALFVLSNTLFLNKSLARTLHIKSFFFSFCAVVWLADLLGVLPRFDFWTVSLLLYAGAYPLYTSLIFGVQKDLSVEKIEFRFRPVCIAFLSMALASAVVVRKWTGIGTRWEQLVIYAHLFSLTCMVMATANFWGIKKGTLTQARFWIATLSILLTQFLYGLDEIVYHRSVPLLDVAVALCNGFSILFIAIAVQGHLGSRRSRN